MDSKESLSVLASSYFTYNPDVYFCAAPKVKYHTQKDGQKEIVMNDAKKGKKVSKPRKGQRGTGGIKPKLPELPKLPLSILEQVDIRSGQNTFNDSRHAREIEQVLKETVSKFPSWDAYMDNGFNIIMYGIGSKLPIFEEFKMYVNRQNLIITINGMQPKINTKKEVELVLEGMDRYVPLTKSDTPEIIAHKIYKDLKDLDDPPSVYLLIQNFDNIASNNPAFLKILVAFARLKHIHILASCDTIRPSIGISTAQSEVLRFLWMNCNTFLPFETELINSVNQTEYEENTAKLTLDQVMKCVTANARKVYSILATMQLEQLNNSRGRSKAKLFTGIEFQVLARKCREGFVAHTDAALKLLLTEFIDHKLIAQSKDNVLSVNMEKEALIEFVKTL